MITIIPCLKENLIIIKDVHHGLLIFIEVIILNLVTLNQPMILIIKLINLQELEQLNFEDVEVFKQQGLRIENYFRSMISLTSYCYMRWYLGAMIAIFEILELFPFIKEQQEKDLVNHEVLSEVDQINCPYHLDYVFIAYHFIPKLITNWDSFIMRA